MINSSNHNNRFCHAAHPWKQPSISQHLLRWDVWNWQHSYNFISKKSWLLAWISVALFLRLKCAFGCSQAVNIKNITVFWMTGCIKIKNRNYFSISCRRRFTVWPCIHSYSLANNSENASLHTCLANPRGPR